MTNLTELEYKLLDAVALHEMSPTNGGIPESIQETGTFCWADEFAISLDITLPQVKGVLSSLVQKKLVIITYEKTERDQDGIDFTQIGFDAWKEQRDAIAQLHENMPPEVIADLPAGASQFPDVDAEFRAGLQVSKDAVEHVDTQKRIQELEDQVKTLTDDLDQESDAREALQELADARIAELETQVLTLTGQRNARQRVITDMFNAQIREAATARDNAESLRLALITVRKQEQAKFNG